MIGIEQVFSDFQFLSHDIPLFEGIISDLFPGVELPKPDYGALEKAVINNIEKRNFQAVPYCIEKIIQVIRQFFYFLVYGSSDTNFCILEKN